VGTTVVCPEFLPWTWIPLGLTILRSSFRRSDTSRSPRRLPSIHPVHLYGNLLIFPRVLFSFRAKFEICLYLGLLVFVFILATYHTILIPSSPPFFLCFLPTKAIVCYSQFIAKFSSRLVQVVLLLRSFTIQSTNQPPNSIFIHPTFKRVLYPGSLHVICDVVYQL
jgi:hypothetical protein